MAQISLTNADRGRQDNPKRVRKPAWLRVKAPSSEAFHDTASLINSYKLPTVCEEAACPNIGECWSKQHVTIMIMGKRCTRACAFCHVDTQRPLPLDPKEPAHIADLVGKMNLQHVVITSVDRDDLHDGGAQHFAKVVHALRTIENGPSIEILTPDFRGKKDAVAYLCKAPPDVFNHNIETVPRLYPHVRKGARYYNSLRLLEMMKDEVPSIFTKSGLMLGLGETSIEISQVMDDMRAAGVDFLTMGQYLQPTPKQVPVREFVTPEAFKKFERMGYAKGFLQVDSGPLVRSSYHADENFAKLKQNRHRKYQRVS